MIENGIEESLIPAGASAESRPGRAPTVPVFDDATPAFAAAVRALQAGAPTRDADVRTIVAEARVRDVFTLLMLVDAARRRQRRDRRPRRRARSAAARRHRQRHPARRPRQPLALARHAAAAAGEELAAQLARRAPRLDRRGDALTIAGPAASLLQRGTHAATVQTHAFGVAIIATILAGSAPAAAPRLAPTDFVIDPARSEIRFTVTKLGFSDVTGTFRESSGEIRYDAATPAASAIRWRVRVASVLTDASSRDALACSGRSTSTPPATRSSIFESRRVAAKPDGALEVTGDLTMRGVTRSITTDVRVRRGLAGPVFETDFEVDRYDFGIAGGTVMGRLIGSRVRVHVRAATQPAPAAGIR